MAASRFSAFCILFGFLFFTLETEIREVTMWSSMVRNSALTMSWLEAADQALSGEVPCSKCKQITRERVTGEGESGFAPPAAPEKDLLSPPGHEPLVAPTFRHRIFPSESVSWAQRVNSPPEPPPE